MNIWTPEVISRHSNIGTAVGHTWAMCSHICSGSYISNVKSMYTSAPGHTVDSIEFIYIDLVL